MDLLFQKYMINLDLEWLLELVSWFAFSLWPMVLEWPTSIKGLMIKIKRIMLKFSKQHKWKMKDLRWSTCTHSALLSGYWLEVVCLLTWVSSHTFKTAQICCKGNMDSTKLPQGSYLESHMSYQRLLVHSWVQWLTKLDKEHFWFVYHHWFSLLDSLPRWWCQNAINATMNSIHLY